MELCAKAAVPEPADRGRAPGRALRVRPPAATTRARRVAFIGRDSRKPDSMAATGAVRRGLGEPEGGFEPPTYHLRGGCSTPELLRRSRQDTEEPERLSQRCGMMRRCPWRRRAASATRAVVPRRAWRRPRSRASLS